jgi:hypothetical protein
MKSKLLAIIAIAVLSGPFNNAVARETYQWLLDALKVDNPNELPVMADSGDDCLITDDEMIDIVSGVLIRSRVKPLTGDEMFERPLYLYVGLNCYKEERYQTYNLRVYFGNASGKVDYLVDQPYGTFRRDDKAGMTTVIKNSTEAAITDFIKANFNL